jgi:hypothetical protein
MKSDEWLRSVVSLLILVGVGCGPGLTSNLMRGSGTGGTTNDGSSGVDASSADASNDDATATDAMGAGSIVQPWPDGTPGYTRSIVKIGDCTGVAVTPDWVLSAGRCGSQVGDIVTSVRPSGDVAKPIDRIASSSTDAVLLHLAGPLTDVPSVPFYWGTTTNVVGQPITCYDYWANGLWTATMPTRAHADQNADPGTFETVRNAVDSTILPGAPGGPCFFEDQLVAVDGGWLANRAGGIETSFAEFRSWMIATVRGQRGRIFQAIDSDAVFVTDRSDQLWRWHADGSRSFVDANLRDFQAIDASVVYVVAFDGTVWRELPDAGNRIVVDETTLSVQAMDATVVYVLGFDFNLWNEIGTYQTRTMVDANVLSFRAVDSSHAFVLGPDRTLWNEIGSAANRTMVDTSVVDFQPVSDTTAYVLRDDFVLWREDGSFATATQVDSGVFDLQAIDDSLVYVVDQDLTLWRERGTSANRELVDRGVVAFQAMDATTVYVLDQTGNLWREQGSSTSRVLVTSR